MGKPMRPEVYIQKASAVHNGKYDYNETEYKNMSTKISIICPEHGIFAQMPQAHLKGQGCPECGKIKQKQSVIAKYGVDNPMKSKTIFEKARATCRKRYGADYAKSSESSIAKEVQDKMIVTNIEKYGAAYPLQNKDIHTKLEATSMERYGATNPMGNSGIKEKARQTCMNKFGCSEPLAAKSICEKINASKRRNHTFASSKPEDFLYELLCDRFGADDVVRGYSSDVYPHICDFYIKPRDMYIEYNGHWTHGRHWFDGNNPKDVETLNLWKERGTDYYLSAIQIWTGYDIRKRDDAMKNALNYVVFWGTEFDDVEFWFRYGCPNGCDWYEMYSWVG